MSKVYFNIEEILNLMQEIVNKEKERCGEADACNCWYQLKDKLKELSQQKAVEE
jgi:hypothetical protein